MTIYIDPPQDYPTTAIAPAARRYGNRWSHLWTDDTDTDLIDLHRIAARLGLASSWFQDRPGFPHYDLVPSKYALAVNYGAVEMTLSEWFKLKQKRDRDDSKNIGN